MPPGANRDAFEIGTCDTSYMIESKKFALSGAKRPGKIKEKTMTFLITLAILSILILVGMRVSLHLYTSGALRDKPLWLLKHLRPLVA